MKRSKFSEEQIAQAWVPESESNRALVLTGG